MKRQIKRFVNACTELRDSASEAGDALRELARTIDVDGQAGQKWLLSAWILPAERPPTESCRSTLGSQDSPKIPPSGEGRF